jgi:hypothetical protein
MNVEEFEQAIVGVGYVRANIDQDGYGSSKYTYFKRSNSGVYCNCDGKPVWLEITYFDNSFLVEYKDLCNIRIIAEAHNSNWIDFKFYSIDAQDLLDKLPEFEYKLQRAWESVN